MKDIFCAESKGSAGAQEKNMQKRDEKFCESKSQSNKIKCQ